MKRKWLMVFGIMVLMCTCIIMTGCSADTQVTITRNADDSEDVITQITIGLTDYQVLSTSEQNELTTAGFKQTTVNGQSVMALTKSQHLDDFHGLKSVLDVDNFYGKIESTSLGTTYYDLQHVSVDMWGDPKSAILSEIEGEYGLTSGRLVALKNQISLIYAFKLGDVMEDHTTGGLPDGAWIENGEIAYIDFGKVHTDGQRVTLSIEGVNEDKSSTTPSVGFTDVEEESWYYSYVTRAQNEGLVNGYGDGTYGPENQVSVAEVAQMLYNIGTDDVGHESWHYPDKHWAFKALLTAKNYGAIDGSESIQSIEPFNVPCTREQAAYMIAKLMQHNLGISASSAQVSIPDIAEVSSQYADAVRYLYGLGIMNGVNDNGTFAPKKTVTRAEMAKIILGAWDLRPSDFKQWAITQPYYKWDGVHRDATHFDYENMTLDEQAYWLKQRNYEIGITDGDETDNGQRPTWT